MLMYASMSNKSLEKNSKSEKQRNKFNIF